MRRVVGSKHVDEAFTQSLPQNFRMVLGPDRRIHLKQRADFVHVVRFAQKIMRAGFCGDSQAARFGIADHISGLFRAHMEDVQLGPECFGEEKRVVHRFRLADIRAGSFPIARIVLAFGFELVGAVGHDLAVLGMNAQRQLRLRDVIERFHAHAVVGEGQVADRFTEEDFVADHAGGGHRKYIFGVGLHDDARNTEIDQRLGFAEFFLNLYLFRVGRRRHGVRHVHDSCDTATNRCRRTGGEVFLMSHARLSKMDVAIEQSRQNMFAFDVDLLFALRQRVVRSNRDDFFAADRDAAFECCVGRYHPTVFDHQICSHCFSFLFSRFNFLMIGCLRLSARASLVYA